MDDDYDYPEFMVVCTACWGNGWICNDAGEKITCTACDGEGYIDND